MTDTVTVAAGYRSAAAVREQRRDVLRRQVAVLGQNEQWLVDFEVRATRRALRELARQRTALPVLGFLDADFASGVDRQALYAAILDAAVDVGGAASADLQLYDTDTDTLRIADQRGFGPQFLAFFASVGRSTPSACALALATGAPVVVDRIADSPIFAGRPTLEPLMDAGSRAVASYPLVRPGGAVAGVLSLHSAGRRPNRSPRRSSPLARPRHWRC
jgi:hypothetical protein